MNCERCGKPLVKGAKKWGTAKTGQRWTVGPYGISEKGPFHPDCAAQDANERNA